MEVNKVFLGDCLEMLRGMDSDSVDCLVTDPPYGYSFMGKDWDKVVPSVEIWGECLRVMKAGSFAFIMSAPRQDVLSHMIVNLDKAGFDTGFTSIYWAYASGFPKATNIGKAVDKKFGNNHKSTYQPNDLNNVYGDKLGGGDTDNSFVPKSDEAKSLDGSYAGFQPKPAVEIIIVAMNPLSEKSYTDQALKNKKGVTWLDDARVPYKSDDDIIPQLLQGKTEINSDNGMYGGSSYNESKTKSMIGGDTDGRFPANLLVSDDVLNDGKVYESGGNEKEYNRVKGYEDYAKETGGNSFQGLEANSDSRIDKSSGSFSRYYDLDKWWEERIKSLPENVRKVFPFLIEPKAAKSEKNFGAENIEGEMRFASEDESGKMLPTKTEKPHKVKGNYHPTVKPIKLMTYLITLGSREGDTILEPFAGSGTTCISARLMNRNFIAAELSPEYHKIAEARIKQYTAQQTIPFT